VKACHGLSGVLLFFVSLMSNTASGTWFLSLLLVSTKGCAPRLSCLLGYGHIDIKGERERTKAVYKHDGSRGVKFSSTLSQDRISHSATQPWTGEVSCPWFRI
jgi:hypothetical protein